MNNKIEKSKIFDIEISTMPAKTSDKDIIDDFDNAISNTGSLCCNK